MTYRSRSAKSKIQIFTELIKENLEDKAFVNNYFDKLDSSAKRMSELVKSLLNYSRITQDDDQLEIAEVDLNLVVDETKQDFELLIDEKKANIYSDLLPVVRGNRMQLGQLFSNIISNALKFSKASPEIKISAATVNKDQIVNPPKILAAAEYHHIIFQDNGIGFENQYSTKIFSLFQRLHGKQHYSGTGIGLALCKKIAENHNGFIYATGELGQGAIFNIFLPV